MKSKFRRYFILPYHVGAPLTFTCNLELLFRDTKPQMHPSRNFNLSGLCDVIGHVTVRLKEGKRSSTIAQSWIMLPAASIAFRNDCEVATKVRHKSYCL